MNSGNLPAEQSPDRVSPGVRLGPSFTLAVVLIVVWLVLLVRGLDLGFTGDLLDYAYHYERFGSFGGMHWLVTEHLHRHLLAGVFSAPIAYLFPNLSAAWYAYALLAHFAAAYMTYVLAVSVLAGRARWLAFTAALFFAFHTLHSTLNFEFPTSGHGNSALFLSLLSLWCFLRYVRQGRRTPGWRDLSLAAYVFAIGTYEQTVLFFLLHPLIAWFEDRAAGVRLSPAAFVRRALADSVWFPIFVVVYLYLLRVLFPGSSNLNLSPAWIVGQLVAGFRAELDPAGFASRLAPTLQGGWLPVTLALTCAFALLLWRWSRREARFARDSAPVDRLQYLACLGLGLTVASIAGVAPTSWGISEHPRMIYPSAVGFGMIAAAFAGWSVRRLPSARPIVALVFSMVIAASVVRYLVVQAEYQGQANARNRVIQAVVAAVPDISPDPLPYILIYSDAHPTRDLWLYAQDNRFPYTFDRIYGVTGLPVDALYFDLDPSLVPGDDVPGSQAHGQYLIAEPEGLYSPLRPGESIDPNRLIILYYDSVTGQAEVVERLPDEVRLRANIVERAPVDWRTNSALIVEPGR